MVKPPIRALSPTQIFGCVLPGLRALSVFEIRMASAGGDVLILVVYLSFEFITEKTLLPDTYMIIAYCSSSKYGCSRARVHDKRLLGSYTKRLLRRLKPSSVSPG